MRGGEVLQLDLVGDGGPKPPRYSVHLAADGSFTVHGRDGEGVPPGAYTVVASSSVEGESWKDKFKGRFVEGKSPLKIDIPDAGEQRVVIDLGAGTVTKS